MSDRRQVHAAGKNVALAAADEARAIGRIRSRGEFDLQFGPRAGRTRMTRAFQSGCLRVRALPPEPDGGLCAVTMNTSGGLAGGDRLRQSVRWEAGARAAVVTQAAEKIYRALSDQAEVRTTLEVESGAHAEWLPQEAILFDGARLFRNMHVRLGGEAHFLGVEALVFGRAAMDERMRKGRVRDAWRIYRDGRLIYADAFELDGAVDLTLQRAAVANGARASGVLIHVANGASAKLEDVRAALARAEGLAAASAWNGVLAARFLAPDGETLRNDIGLALGVLRDGRPAPRVWAC